MPKITDLSSAASLTGAEEVPVHQSTSTVKTTVDDVAAYTSDNLTASGVTAATYGDATHVGTFTVGADGRITSASSTAITGAGGGTTVYSVANGRLTLTSGTPVTTTDVTGATTIYWTPYKGNQIGLYNGSSWDVITFAETSIALGTLAAAFQAYDIFAYNNSGTLALEKLEWQNATVTMTIASPCVVTWTSGGIANGNTVVLTTGGALPTGLSANTQYYAVNVSGSTFNLSATPDGTAINTSGSQSGTHTGHSPIARQTALALQDGISVKSGDATRRYLGTFMSTSTTTTEDSAGGTSSQVGGKRFLWNYYYRARRHAVVIDTTDSWAYSNTATWRAAHGAAGNIVEFVQGMVDDVASATLVAVLTAGNTGSGSSQSGVGLNSTTGPIGAIGATYGGSLNTQVAACAGSGRLGYNFFAWLERATQTGTTTWYGDGGGGFQSRLKVELMT